MSLYSQISANILVSIWLEQRLLSNKTFAIKPNIMHTKPHSLIYSHE